VTGDAPPIIVWLAPEPPAAEQRGAIDAWARRHGVTLERPSASAPVAAASASTDPQAADRVEALLERARDAITARDASEVDRALDAAEAALRVRAGLPQAAWLMAEVERTRAARFWRLEPVDAEAAARAMARADALDGGRLSSMGDPPPAGPSGRAHVAVDLEPGASLRVDGREEAADFASPEGLHAVVVVQDGAPVWAAWVEWPTGDFVLRPDVPAPAPCSEADLRRARLAGDAVTAPGVACIRWVAASPGARPGSLRVATCAGSHCGPVLEWPEPPPAWSRAMPAPVPAPTAPRGWPAWATWTLVSSVVAVAAGVGAVAAASGAFSSAPAESRFVTGGVARSP
jgi:hypothetical protein